MNSFHDLEKSNNFDDYLIYIFLTKLIDTLFGKSDNIIIDSNSENEKNQQLINDQWKLIEFYFKVPKRVKSTQKYVRQTLKYIVEYLNNKYQFKQPIQWKQTTTSVRDGKKTFSKSYTTLSFI
jgi:hypothetical protein